jgi:hypothetical protein
MSAIETEVLDVRLTRFGDPQPVQPEQHRKGGVLAVDAFGGEQEPAELPTVQAATFAGWTLGRRTYWAGLYGIVPSMRANL